MVNPIMAAMNRGSNNPMAQIAGIKQMLQGKNPDAVFNMMMQNNPQFAQFVQANRGKSPADIAKAYGIDMEQVRELMR